MSVLAIFGPTASGKTDVGEAVARRIPAELVSADAMQVYRGLPILTNQSSVPNCSSRTCWATGRSRMTRGRSGRTRGTSSF